MKALLRGNHAVVTERSFIRPVAAEGWPGGAEAPRRPGQVVGPRADVARAAAGVAGTGALHAVSAAYRSYALARPGRYAASVLAPAPGDDAYLEVATQAIRDVDARAS